MKFYNRLRYLLILIDSISVAAGWLLSYWVRVEFTSLFGKPLNTFSIYLKVLPIVVLLWIIGNASFGLYKKIRGLTRLEEFMSILKADFMGLLLLMALGFLFKEYDFGRSVVLLSGIANLIFLMFGRWFFRKIEEMFIKKGKGKINVLIIGAGTMGIRTLQKISDQPEIGYSVIGYLDDDEEKLGMTIGKAQVVGKLSELRKIVQEKDVNEVIFAIPGLPHKQLMDYLMELDGLNVTIRVVSDLFGVIAHDTNIDLIEDFPIFDLKSASDDTIYPFMKRVFDLLVAVPAFILTLPIWLLIVVIIKIDSKGPVFFIQERVGKNGKIFNMYKFRTMYVETPKYAKAPADKDDPRITKVGGFLRRSSLDELPQLINVLIGNMSIVGPRPEMPFIVEQYEEWQRKRLEVLPGITGLWQILGRKDLPLHENLEYDFYYIKNRSFWLDITILLKTVPTLLKKKGAY